MGALEHPAAGLRPRRSVTLSAGSAFAPLGPIYDNACAPATSPPCVPTETPWGSSYRFGFLYGANIIDSWTTPRGTGNLDADIYWNVSTWSPYASILMKTRISH